MDGCQKANGGEDAMSWQIVLKRDLSTYVVQDEIWNEAGGEGMDSMEDLERKLGRRLTPEDFTDDPLNWMPRDEYLAVTESNQKQYDILRDRLPDTKQKIEQYMQRPVWTPGRRKGKTPDKIKMIQEMMQ
jgi:hypothetical protein